MMENFDDLSGLTEVTVTPELQAFMNNVLATLQRMHDKLDTALTDEAPRPESPPSDPTHP